MNENKLEQIYSQIRSNSHFPEQDVDDSRMDLYLSRIQWMNETFQLENNAIPTNLGVVRLLKFYKTIIDEVTEFLDCTDTEDLKYDILDTDPFLADSDDPEYIENLVKNYEENTGKPPTVNMVALADTLVDIMVYATSEMVRWGIPIEDCLNAVMESQVTKLDTNGQPVKSPDNAKFIKGPYFQPPEPKIEEILQSFTEQEDVT